MPERPIPLRLHHLDNIQKIIRWGIDQYRQTFRDDLIFQRSDPQSTTYDREYYSDIVGPHANEEKFIASVIGSYQFYLSLSHTTPLDLIPLGEDQICLNCFVGQHCFDKQNYEQEARYAHQLDQTKKNSGIPGNFELMGDIPTFTFHVHTTMGVVKAILAVDQTTFS